MPHTIARIDQTATLPAITGAPIDASILAGQVSAATLEQYAMYARAYAGFARAAGRDALQPSTLAAWRTALFEDGYRAADGSQCAYSVNAINLRLAAVRRIMRGAATQGLIDGATADAFKRIEGLTLKANKDRRKTAARTRIDRDQMNAICSAPEAHTKGMGARLMHTALLMTLRQTGARISDIVGMTQADITWLAKKGRDGSAGAWVASFMGKNETEPVTVELGAPAKHAIDAWLTYRRDVLGVDVAAIFTGFGGRGDRQPHTEPITRTSAWKIVQRYTALAGVENVKPHDFRRYVGTQLATVDIRLAQKQLRHKRIETTAQHYVLDDVQTGHMSAL